MKNIFEKKICRRNERGDISVSKMFDRKISTVTNMNFLVSMKVSTKGDVIVIICHMVGCPWVWIPRILVFPFGAGEHGFQRCLFNRQFFLNLSIVGVVVWLVVWGCWWASSIVRPISLKILIKSEIAFNHSMPYLTTELVLGFVVAISSSFSYFAPIPIRISSSLILMAATTIVPIWSSSWVVWIISCHVIVDVHL